MDGKDHERRYNKLVTLLDRLHGIAASVTMVCETGYREYTVVRKKKKNSGLDGFPL